MVPHGRESIVRALSLGRIGDPEISGVYDGVRKGLEDVVKKLFIVSSENQQSLNFSSPPMKTQKYALRFKITLLGHSPRVWRRIEIPSTYSFWDLHVAIQDAMGWLDCHLHNFMFRVGTNRIDIGIPERGDTETTQLRGWDVDAAEYFTEVGSQTFARRLRVHRRMAERSNPEEVALRSESIRPHQGALRQSAGEVSQVILVRRARKLLGLPLEFAYGQLRLADDRFERSTLDLSVVGDGDSNGRAGNPLLHNNVTASFSIVPTAISYTLRKTNHHSPHRRRGGFPGEITHITISKTRHSCVSD
jgi:hypothetical protein